MTFVIAFSSIINTVCFSPVVCVSFFSVCEKTFMWLMFQQSDFTELFDVSSVLFWGCFFFFSFSFFLEHAGGRGLIHAAEI